MDYYFECDCGKRISVRASQADSMLTCDCGRENRVPRLSKLSKVSEATSEVSPFAENPVAGPARMLQVFAGVSIALFAIAFVLQVVVLALSRSDRETHFFIQLIWFGLLIVLHTIIFLGASNMLERKNYGFAKTAAILALLPVSLCCVLGLPFGLLALSALNRPGVRESFSS